MSVKKVKQLLKTRLKSLKDKCQEKEISIIQMQELEYLAIAFNREKSNLEVWGFTWWVWWLARIQMHRYICTCLWFHGPSLVAQTVKNLPAMQETWVHDSMSMEIYTYMVINVNCHEKRIAWGYVRRAEYSWYRQGKVEVGKEETGIQVKKGERKNVLYDCSWVEVYKIAIFVDPAVSYDFT